MLHRTGGLIVVGVFVTYLAHPSKMVRLPIQALLKDQLHLGPDAAADFLAVVGLAWYLKPIAGALSDEVPLFGSRRRSYLIVSGCAGMLSWLIAGLAPARHGALLVALVLVNVAAAVGNTTLGGLLVEEGRRHDASGKLSALRLNAMNAVSLAAGPVGGWLAGRTFGWTSTTGAVLMSALAGMALVLPGSEQAAAAQRPVGADRPARFRALLASRALWGTAALSLLFYIAPGFATVLYYRQCDVLSLSNVRVGILEAVNSGCALFATLGFGALSRRVAPRRWLVVGIVSYAVSSLVYLAYRSWSAALVIEAANGTLAALGLVVLQDLAARATPQGHEALGYALILGIANAGVSLSEVIGARLPGGLGIGFDALVVVNAAWVALTALVVPLLPAEIFDRSEH